MNSKLIYNKDLITTGSKTLCLNFRSNKLTKSSVPMNDFYWWKSIVIDDKAINMRNLEYVEYQDNIINYIKPFKKG